MTFQLRGQLRDACKREAGGTESENELPVKKGRTKIIYGIFKSPPSLRILTWFDFEVWIMRSGKEPRRPNLKLQPDYELQMMKQHLRSVKRFLRLIGMS